MLSRNFRKGFYAVMGWCALGIGLVGLALPVMPGTVFLVIALACFAKSNERLERWLLEHPRFGPPLKQWHESRYISRKAKVLIITTLGLSTGAVILFIPAPIFLKATLGIAGVSACVYLLTLRGRSPENETTPTVPTSD